MLICRNAEVVHVLVHMFRESLRNPALDQSMAQNLHWN